MDTLSPLPANPVSRLTHNGLKPHCATCSLADICLPLGLPEYDINRLDSLIDQRVKLKRGSHLYRRGDRFDAIYAIRRGSFKSTVISQDGREQITGFHLTGDIIGMSAISSSQYRSDTTAMEDSEACVIPFGRLEGLLRDVPSLQNNFHRIMSREMVRHHDNLMLLGNMSAEERLASFLLDLARRYAKRGYSATSFNLRMTRSEIANFVGLRLETVSRTLTKLQKRGLITLEQRLVTITDRDGLKAVLTAN